MRPENTPEVIEQARVLVLEKPSTSYVQRKLGIGYNQAAELMEHFESEGLISAPNAAGLRKLVDQPRREAARPSEGQKATSAPAATDLDIMEAIHRQISLLGFEDREPMSPVERKLGNAILVLLNVLMAREPRPTELK